MCARQDQSSGRSWLPAERTYREASLRSACTHIGVRQSQTPSPSGGPNTAPAAEGGEASDREVAGRSRGLWLDFPLLWNFCIP